MNTPDHQVQRTPLQAACLRAALEIAVEARKNPERVWTDNEVARIFYQHVKEFEPKELNSKEN